MDKQWRHKDLVVVSLSLVTDGYAPDYTTRVSKHIVGEQATSSVPQNKSLHSYTTYKQESCMYVRMKCNAPA